MIINDNTLNGLYIFIGKQGSGKTLFAVKLLVDNMHYKEKIFSNITLFNLNREYTKVTLSDRNIERLKGIPKVLDMLDEDPNIFNNSILFLDEIHKDLNSLDWIKKNNRRLHGFFSQLRKRNCLVLATAQYLMHIDNRIRDQAKNVFDMSQISPNIFQITVNEIDGYYQQPINRFQMNLSEYFKYYDTNEIVD